MDKEPIQEGACAENGNNEDQDSARVHAILGRQVKQEAVDPIFETIPFVLCTCFPQKLRLTCLERKRDLSLLLSKAGFLEFRSKSSKRLRIVPVRHVLEILGKGN